MESLQKAATKHFLGFDLGVPWEVERESEGDKISLTFFDPTIREVSKDDYLATFKIRLVCTVSTEGLYDLSDLSGSAASMLLLPILDICATPDLKEVKIDLFDFKYGYKQSLMEQTYTARIRG